MMYSIFLVDDEPSSLDFIKRIINSDKRFFVCGEAFSVREAKIKVPELLPDVIFTDIKMPVETGIDLLKWLSDQNCSSLSVVLSGYNNFDYVHDAFILGAEEYLLKPVDPTKLNLLLNKIYKKLDDRKSLPHLNSDTTDNEYAGENSSTSSGDTRQKSSVILLVEKIDNFLQHNLKEDNSIFVICRKFGISQPYLSKIIKKEKGCTYNEYLISMKISYAKLLLKNSPNLLIADVAELSGFSDQFYFSKVFKNTTGITPTEYRNNHSA